MTYLYLEPFDAQIFYDKHEKHGDILVSNGILKKTKEPCTFLKCNFCCASIYIK
jgi:hypothetical protein